jgi:hypothetical protein
MVRGRWYSVKWFLTVGLLDVIYCSELLSLEGCKWQQKWEMSLQI